MSLQLWMPLMGDLRNQGLGDYSISTLGTLSWVTGKLGSQAMKAGDGTQVVNGIRIEDTFTDLLNGDYSVSVWVKPYGTHVHYNGSIFSSGNWNTAKKRWAFGVSQDNSKVDVLCSDYNTYVTCAVPVNEWTHLVCTCGSDRIVKLYKNGEYITSVDRSASNTFDSDNVFTCIGRESYANGYFSFNGAIQDFRLYDHCLSPMEVKQISQGLVLHYPLNRNGWGQENLAMDSHDLTHTCAKGNKYISKRRTADVIQLRSDGFYECKSFSTSFGGLAIYANQFNLSSGDILTYSFYVYTDGSTKSLSFYPMMYNSSGSRDTSSTLSISLDGGSYTAGNSKSWGSINNTMPQKHWVTFVWNETMESIISNGGKIELSIQPHGTWNNANEYVCLFAPKLEVGSIPTPWCPNSSDVLATTMGLNSTTEYDCSGFCNNGTKVGTLGWSSNTPKYNVSLDVTTDSCARYIYGPAQTQLTDQITLACWLYQTSATATSGGNSTPYQFALSQGRDYLNLGFNIVVNNGKSAVYAGNGGSESGARTQLVGTNVITNSWHHVVATYDNGALKLYVDGQLDKQTTVGALDYVDAPALVIGKMAYGYTNTTSYFPFIGYISDVRVYATALSASDVLSLYQNCATIDPDGTIRGQIRS